MSRGDCREVTIRGMKGAAIRMSAVAAAASGSDADPDGCGFPMKNLNVVFYFGANLAPRLATFVLLLVMS